MQQLQSGRKDLDWSTMGTLASVATARDGAQTTFNWTSKSSSSRVLCTSSHLVILLLSYEPNRARLLVLLILMILSNASPCGGSSINSKSINWCTIKKKK